MKSDEARREYSQDTKKYYEMLRPLQIPITPEAVVPMALGLTAVLPEPEARKGPRAFTARSCDLHGFRVYVASCRK